MTRKGDKLQTSFDGRTSIVGGCIFIDDGYTSADDGCSLSYKDGNFPTQCWGLPNENDGRKEKDYGKKIWPRAEKHG